MSLFGKMNQTEKAKTTAGSSGKQPWRSRWQKGSKALYHIGRLPVPTYTSQDIASGARRCCRPDIVASSNILLYCWLVRDRAAGLSKENCPGGSDCHTWRREVLTRGGCSNMLCVMG